MTFPSSSARVKKLEKAIANLDRLLEVLHKDFNPHDRKVEPAVDLISKARTTLENLLIAEQRKVCSEDVKTK